VESIKTTSYPARSRGVETAKIPSGAVASELAKDGKKKTIFLDVRRAFSETMSGVYENAISELSAVCLDVVFAPSLGRNCEMTISRQADDIVVYLEI